MFPLSLLVCLAGAINLGSWDFQPWDNVVPSNDPAGFPLVATSRLVGVIEGRNSSGALLDRDTLQYWTDERGICRSARWWRFRDTMTVETMDLYGVHPGRNATPPDSGRSSLTVAGKLREVGQLRSQHSGRRSLWVFERDPAPEGFHFDWDSTLVDRDEKGRIVSKREVWTDFAWYSDSITWSRDGSPSEWITRSGGGWSDLVEIHVPKWSAGRLVQDEIHSITNTRTEAPDTTHWSVSCSWIEDSLLRGCSTTILRSSDTTQPTYRRRFDSLVVVRDDARRPRRLEVFLDGRFKELVLWDIQGREVSQRTLDGDIRFQSLSTDSSQFRILPWPVRSEYGYGPAATLFDAIAVDEITTFDWRFESEGLGVSRRKPSSGVRYFLEDGLLRLQLPSASSGTMQLFDPAGRERARTSLRDGSASLALPNHGGVWLWRLTDSEGRETDQGRITLP